ncbi:hypothetical protein CU098_002683, partial [Rhizopus stolonifer]
VRENLDFESGISILDVGCGSGDMDNDYPNCTYRGCDIVDVTNKVLDLDRFKYDYGNVLQRLPYDDNTFDFVHMRLFMYALRKDEWPVAIEEVIRVIPEDTSTICYRHAIAVNSFAAKIGQNPHIAREIEGLLLSNDKIKIIQSNYQHYSGKPVSKKFVWNFLEATKGVMKYLGPHLGLNNKEEELDYMEKLRHGMLTTKFSFIASSISVQKLCKASD